MGDGKTKPSPFGLKALFQHRGFDSFISPPLLQPKENNFNELTGLYCFPEKDCDWKEEVLNVFAAGKIPGL